MIDRIKAIIFPELSGEVTREMDMESVKNIYYISIAAALIEIIILVLFVATLQRLDREAWISIGSVLFCAALCLAGFLYARRLLKQPSLTDHPALPFRVIYSVVLSVWAVWVSYRQYVRGEQLTTFYTVILMQVCFLPMKPWISILLMAGVYAALYLMLYSIDRAAGVNVLNFFVLACLSAGGMVVRFYSQARMSEKTAQLEHANRHDILTGLRNRYALEEDALALAGRHVRACMIDINYFKMFNDTYGHVVGDAVLRETANRIRGLFPGCYCYRYGGDEFLVLNPGEAAYTEDIYRFSMSEPRDIQLLLSMGHAEGTPQDHGQMFELIAAADASLYEVKRRTHSPEFGGIDRRRRR